MSKIGVYVDTANLYRSGGQRMQYDVLREFACRDGAELLRLNAYVSYDADRAKTDTVYARNVNRFYSVLRDFGYKVIVKEVKWYEDESGKRYGKADADLDLAVDMLAQSANLDRVLLVSGDGDFSKAVKAVQNKGCRVEVIAMDNVSLELRQEADMFISGYLIPNLIPVSNDTALWGQIGSVVRGVCYFHKLDYGFMRFLGKISSDIWIIDAKRPDSPYKTAFFHDTNLPNTVDPQTLPNYNHVFEFELTESTRRDGSFEATNIHFRSRVPG